MTHFGGAARASDPTAVVADRMERRRLQRLAERVRRRARLTLAAPDLACDIDGTIPVPARGSTYEQTHGRTESNDE